MFGSYNDPKKTANPGVGGPISAWPASSLRYEDMNVSTGGVARDASIGGTFTDVYNQTGSGLLVGFVLTLENAFDEWEVRLTIDDTNVIFLLDTSDITNNNVYDFDNNDADSYPYLGINANDKTLRWRGPLGFPVTYDSRIRIEVRYVKGGNKKFKAGLVTRTI